MNEQMNEWMNEWMNVNDYSFVESQVYVHLTRVVTASTSFMQCVSLTLSLFWLISCTLYKLYGTNNMKIIYTL
jgi:hypothetical protein